MSDASPLLGDPAFIQDLQDRELSGRTIATKWGCSETMARKWRNRINTGGDLPTETLASESELHNEDGSLASAVKFSEKAWGHSDYREFIRSQGQNPDEVTFTWGWTSNPAGGFWNKLNNVRPVSESTLEAGPKWPVIQAGPILAVSRRMPAPALVGQWETAVLLSDTQIGFRELDDGVLEPFHDEAAISVALQIIAAENPDQTVVMGDIIDLAAQSRWSQEAGFARTTQPSIDRTTRFGAEMRDCTSGKIIEIEGNHDKRMQNFVEANALSAFGLKKGNMPDDWPVMSMPNLLRLKEYDIIYKDAYPAAHWWVNDQLRCEHGTRANSAGSTAAQYMNATPHISRAHGHHHRLEIQSKTTYDRVGKIRSMAISPGCLCRVDGAVPSVNGAIGANGKSAEVFENWQQGIAVVRYKPSGEFFVDLVQIDDGVTVYQGQEIRAVV